MLLTFILLNWMFSFMFIFMNHPLSLGCILLLQTIIISLSMGFYFVNFWFSYIIFLIMIGGMLVLFIYMTSIASNEKFNMPKYTLLFCPIMFIMMLISILMSDYFYTNTSKNLFSNLSQMKMSLFNMIMNKFMNYPNMQMMILLMIYLLITLIATVKIAGKNLGTLRQK